MKRFLAIYIGTADARAKAQWDTIDASDREALQAKGFAAWMEWGRQHAAAIIDNGGPLGRTKRAAKGGIEDIKNTMVGYVVVEAESHAAAAKMFENHPHFTIFPGDSVEIMECLPLPGQ